MDEEEAAASRRLAFYHPNRRSSQRLQGKTKSYAEDAKGERKHI
jgi:hypothetical protein